MTNSLSAKTNVLIVLTKYNIGKNSTENQFKFVALANSLYIADVGVILKTLFFYHILKMMGWSRVG